MTFKELLGEYKRMGVSLDKYYAFLQQNGISTYRIVEGIPSKYFKFVKVVIIEKGIFLDTTRLINHLVEKYQLKDKETKDYYRELKFIKTRKELEEGHPELREEFDTWYYANRNLFRRDIKKIGQHYINLYREKNIISSRIDKAEGKKLEHYNSRLAAIEEEIGNKKKDIVFDFYALKYLETVFADLGMLMECQKNPYKPAHTNIVLQANLLYHYLASTVLKSIQKEGISDEEKAKQLDYLERYKEFFIEKVDEDNNVTYECMGIPVVLSVAEFLDYLKGNQLKK